MIWSHWSTRLFIAGLCIVTVSHYGNFLLGLNVLLLVLMYETRLRHE